LSKLESAFYEDKIEVQCSLSGVLADFEAVFKGTSSWQPGPVGFKESLKQAGLINITGLESKVLQHALLKVGISSRVATE